MTEQPRTAKEADAFDVPTARSKRAPALWNYEVTITIPVVAASQLEAIEAAGRFLLLADEGSFKDAVRTDIRNLGPTERAGEGRRD